MADYRKLIHQMAVSPKVASGTRARAEQVLARARQIDPAGDFRIEETTATVNGMKRTAYRVVNRAQDAALSEFGAEGRPALRPLGRAGRAFRG